MKIRSPINPDQEKVIFETAEKFLNPLLNLADNIEKAWTEADGIAREQALRDRA